MSDIVSSGKALYWGTSEWAPDEIRAAWEIAERHHLHKPVMEQPQYNLLHRMRVEFEYARLYDDIGLGLTIWSPLASGVLTGQVPRRHARRLARCCPGYEWLQGMLTDPKTNEKVRKLKVVADDLGCTLAQLSLAWCTKNKRVSTGDHRCEPGVAGAREHGRARRRRAPRPRRDGAHRRGGAVHRVAGELFRSATQICMRPVSPGASGGRSSTRSSV